MALCSHAPELTGVAGNPTSPVHRLDPRVKVIGLLGVTVVAVSTPLSAWPVFAACALVLVAVAVAARVGPRVVWVRARLVLLPVLALALVIPFVRPGGAGYALGPLAISGAGLGLLLTVAAKAIIGTVAAVLLGTTTPFPAVLRALEAMRVPRLPILIAAFMHRYLFTIVAEVERMRAALAARGYRPRSILRTAAIGRLAASLFLRTYTRGERVYLAMLSRGYAGTMPQAAPLRLSAVDGGFLVLLAAAVVPLRVALGLA